MTVLAGARVVTADGVLDDGWVRIEGERIVEVGRGGTAGGTAGGGTAGGGSVVDLGGGVLVPGFIDVHVHGGGGHDMARSADDMRAAVAFQHAHGTTRTLVSLVTAPLDDLVESLGWAAGLTDEGVGEHGHVGGSHLEGPFLSHARCGAQNPDHLREPSAESVERLVTAARGTLRCITLAPELPGALDRIPGLRGAGVVVAVGHTDASFEQAVAAFDAGATLATHLFNGMRPVHHREPGPVIAALDRGAFCELINDGIHLHPSIVRLVADRPERIVLITDAIDATGMGDGTYVLGGQEVRVTDGRAELLRTGSLAGSTLTMDAAFRRAVHDVELDLVTASGAASGNPARAMGWDGDTGAIRAGLAADLVHLDDELQVQAVMTAGRWTRRP